MVSAGFFEFKDDLEGCRCSGRKKNRGHCPVLNDDGAKWPVPDKYCDLSYWDEHDQLMREVYTRP